MPIALKSPGVDLRLSVTGGTARQNLLFKRHLIRALVIAAIGPSQLRLAFSLAKGFLADQLPLEEIGWRIARYSDLANLRQLLTVPELLKL